MLAIDSEGRRVDFSDYDDEMFPHSRMLADLLPAAIKAVLDELDELGNR